MQTAAAHHAPRAAAPPPRPVIVIEALTVRNWLVCVWPSLIRRRLAGQLDRGLTLGVIDGSARGWSLARLMAPWLGLSIEPVEFRLCALQDDDGLLIRLRLTFGEMDALYQDLLRDAVYRDVIAQPAARGTRLETFLMRIFSCSHPKIRQTWWRALLLVHVCVSQRRRLARDGADTLLWLERRPWWRSIERYAGRMGVRLRQLPPTWSLDVPLRAWVPLQARIALKLMRTRGAWRTIRRWGFGRVWMPAEQGARMPVTERWIAVEHSANINLDHPERMSDLFFWQQSTIPGRDVMLVFSLMMDPLDEAKLAELEPRGIGAVAVHPNATASPRAPVWVGPLRSPAPRIPQPVRRLGRLDDSRWMRSGVRDYRQLVAYWRDLLRACGTKIYVSWYKFDKTHCAIGDALRELGGVTALYQRAYEGRPSLETSTAADVFFAFSKDGASLEQGSRSIIPRYVITGWLGEHRFGLLRPSAKALRASLLAKGVTRVLAYTDENSWADGRWHTGHDFMRTNYVFLLERLLGSPWLGLVIKPKVPTSLRERLGPVAELLRRAEATGRCLVIEGGTLHGAFPPAAAGLAADVLIHGHLCAGTAGVEAALAGVPTLLLDREGWAVSPLYELGVGRVVFKDWETLWQGLTEHWSAPGGRPGFADWSPMLDRFDPFRDGRASERMGTYIAWLLEAFKAGRSREDALAEAADRYTARWGRDKVLAIGPGAAVNAPAELDEPYVLRVAP